MPLELFVFIGSFLEELLSPIPSLVVLLPAGAVAEVQQLALAYLLVLAVIAGCGRVFGAVILYWIADKSEGAALSRGRKLFGISHKEIQRFGARFGKSKGRDWSLLFLMHAVPIFPAAAISLACGVIKVRHKLFVTATLAGTIVNAVIYLYLGYAGMKGTDTLRTFEQATSIATSLVVATALTWLALFILRKRRRTTRR